MKAENFCFWLQGFFELNKGTTDLTPEQVALIQTHLGLVFQHDPSMAHDQPLERRLQPPFPRPWKPDELQRFGDPDISHDTKVYC